MFGLNFFVAVMLVFYCHNLRKRWLTQEVTGFSPQGLEFVLRVVHVRFVVGVDTGI